MIDLTSAQNALKDAYLVAACNQLNTKTNPLLTKIKQSSADVYGKQIIKVAARKHSLNIAINFIVFKFELILFLPSMFLLLIYYTENYR